MISATADGLQKYDEIHVNTALLIVTQSTKHLLAQGGIHINMAKMIEVEDGVEICTVNGGLTIGPESSVPAKRTLLTVNGGLTIHPGSENVVREYAYIIVNGGLTIAESVPFSNMTVNGGIVKYPD
jgi:hypothetical protein